jgi:hypothetical protein
LTVRAGRHEFRSASSRQIGFPPLRLFIGREDTQLEAGHFALDARADEIGARSISSSE